MIAMPIKNKEHLTARQWVVLSLILLLGLVMRLSLLGKQSLWLDEMTSILVSQAPLIDVFQGRVFDNFSPPLYYVLLKMWGYLIPLDEIGLRLFSALIDFCNILLFWLLARHLFSPWRCLSAVAAYAFSPFLLYYAQEGRMYALLVFWVLIYSLTCMKIFIHERAIYRWSFLSGIILALGVYTHYYFAFFAIGLNLLALLFCRRSKVHIVAILCAGLCGIALFSPWIHIVSTLAHSGGQSFRVFNLLVLPYAVFRFIVGYAVFPLNMGIKADRVNEIIRHAPHIIVVFSVVILMLKEAVACKESEGRKVAASLLWLGLAPLLIAALISTRTPMLSERYLIVSLPFFILLLVSNVKLTGNRAVIVVFFSLLVWGNMNYFFSPSFGKAQWHDAAYFVADRAANSDLILIDPDYSTAVLKFYMNKSRRGQELLANVKPERRFSDLASSLDSDKKVILVSSGYKIGRGVEAELKRYLTLNDTKIFPLETGIVVSSWGIPGGMIKQ